MNWPNFSSDNISVNFEAIAKAECVFPFNYEGKSYNACTQDGAANYEFWCATSVTDSLTKYGAYGMGWGYCTELCPIEDSPGTYQLSNNKNHLPSYESGTCDFVQFSFDDSEDPNNYQNFTKQSANVNGRPFYCSINQSILWWSIEEESWLYSTYEGQGNVAIKSKCSTFDSKCLARRDGKYTFQYKNTTHLLSSFEVCTSYITLYISFQIQRQSLHILYRRPLLVCYNY